MRLSKIEKHGIWFEVVLSENGIIYREFFVGDEQVAIVTANEWEGGQYLTIDAETELEAA